MCQWPEAPCNSRCLGKNITISATSRSTTWTVVPRAEKLKPTHLGVEQKHQVIELVLLWHTVGVGLVWNQARQDQSLFFRSAKSSTVASKPPHMELHS